MVLLSPGGGQLEVWDEIAFNHDLEIPPNKPDMEKLLGYKVSYQIVKAEVIGTRLTSGNPPLPVRKVIIDGIANITAKYVANVPDQQVHGAHWQQPFSDLIEWPGGPAPGTRVCVDVVEEHVQIHMIDERTLSKVIVLQLNVTIDTSQKGCGG